MSTIPSYPAQEKLAAPPVTIPSATPTAIHERDGQIKSDESGENSVRDVSRLSTPTPKPLHVEPEIGKVDPAIPAAPVATSSHAAMPALPAPLQKQAPAVAFPSQQKQAPAAVFPSQERPTAAGGPQDSLEPLGVKRRQQSIEPPPFSLEHAEPQPSVQITIGRIEVRATPPTNAAAQQARPRPITKTMSLDDYLQQRARGGRG